MTDYKFSGKYIISTDIRCITGLHIGGTDEGFEIGGVDSPVIKDPLTGYPYIPGSSLKGKMRSLLEWAYADFAINFGKDKKGNPTGELCQCGTCEICLIFGCSADKAKEPARLIVRDAFPKKPGTITEWGKLGDNIYTEAKTENAIDRLTSAANPRTIERVPAESVFEAEMVFDLYKKNDVKILKWVFQAMHLLEDSTLGGGGSRGSGKIKFKNIRVSKRSVEYYINNEAEETIAIGDKETAKTIVDKFESLFTDKKES